MKSEQVINHGQFIDTINYPAFIKEQSKMPTLDNKVVVETIVKPKSTAKTLSKVIGKPSQRHR